MTAVKRKPLISLCMIVRNEAAGLARCLASAAAGVDEIIVVDTGSTDDTKAIAAAFTRQVYDDLWDDDFAAARQRSFDCADGEWILFLDGDDELVNAGELRRLCTEAPADVTAICLRYITGRDAQGNVTQQLWRERIVRRDAYRWAGRAHEVLVPTRAGRQLQSEAAHVVHHGKPGAGVSGLERNVRILKDELARQGEKRDSRTLFYLARDTMLLGAKARALELFKEYLKIATWREEIYVAWLFVARLHLQLGGNDAASGAALRAASLWPARPDAYFFLAELAYFERAWPRVVFYCELARSYPMPDVVLFVDPLVISFRWIIYYTNALHQLGRTEAALAWTRRALQVVPTDVQHQINEALFLRVLAAAPAPAAEGAPAF